MFRERDWLSAAEAADRLDVSESTALMDAKKGRIHAYDRGEGRRPRWLLSRAEVDALVASGGRPDRRGVGRKPTVSMESASEIAELRSELHNARREVQELHAEIARLRGVARNANVAVQAQTESLQQYLLEDRY